MTDLVELCTIERRKNHLMTKANLNHSLIVYYLQLLIKQGLIEPRPADGYIIYGTTENEEYFSKNHTTSLVT